MLDDQQQGAVTLDPSEVSSAPPAASSQSAPVTLDASEVSGGSQQGPVNPYANGRFSQLPPNNDADIAFRTPASVTALTPRPRQTAADQELEREQGPDYQSVPRGTITTAPTNAQQQMDQQAAMQRLGRTIHAVPRAPLSQPPVRVGGESIENAKDEYGNPLIAPKPGTPEYEQLSHNIAAQQYQESQDELGAAEDVSGISGAKTAVRGIGELSSLRVPGTPLNPYGAPLTAEQAAATKAQALKGATDVIAGGGSVAMTFGAPEVGGIAVEALNGSLPARIALSKFAGQLAVGGALSYGAGKVADRYNLTPEAKGLLTTSAFFFPSLFGLAGVHEAFGELPEGGEGYSATAPGGKVGVGVAQTPEATEIRAGVKGVGSVGVRIPRGPRAPEAPGGRLPGGEGEPVAPPSASPAPPSAPQVQQDAQIAEVTRLAAAAQQTRVTAEQLTGSRPAPPPKPKIPNPPGIDDGHLTPEVLDQAGQAIRAMPPAARPKMVLEAVQSLTKWIAGKGTIIDPENQVVNVDTPHGAQAAATKIVNAALDKQKDQAEAAAKEKEENLATAQDERDEAITPTETKKSTPDAQPVQIPNSPQVQRARAAVQGAPQDATADHFDQIIRKTAMVTTPVRKALVDEEVQRRANMQEDAAEAGMTGQPAAPGQSRVELQKWADGVKNGEHPFVHIPAKSTFVPSGVDGLKRTEVKGAGAFSGTYYHDPEVSAADIRKAARDKQNPQGALDAVVANWKASKGEPVELAQDEVAGPEVGHSETQQNQPVTSEVAQPTASVPEVGHPVEGKVSAKNTYRSRYEQQVELDKNEGAQTYIQVKKVLPGGRFTYETYTPEGKLLSDGLNAASKLSKRKGKYHGLGATFTLPEGESFTPEWFKSELDRLDARPSKNETPLDKFEALGRSPYEITQKEWTDLQRAHRAALGQDETSGTKAAPYADYEEYHRDSVKTAIRYGLDVPEEVLADYPDLAPVKLTPEAASGLHQIVEAVREDDPDASLDSVLRDPADGKIITQALVNDGIITNSESDVNPATALLTTRARAKVGDALLTSLFSPELVEAAPPFVREKLLGSMGSIGSITETSAEWNLKPALDKAIEQYGAAFRGEDTQDHGPVVDAIVKKLDGSPEEMRKAFSTYAVSASSPGDTPNPVEDFNIAFNTELTKEQFEEGMKASPASSSPATTTTEESAPVEAAPSKPLAKGDRVTYTTNKGKERTGEVAWTDGKKVRITDNGSTVNKNIEDVTPVESPAATTGEASLIDHLHLTFSTGRGPKDYHGLKKLVTEFDGTEPTQLRMKEAQEAYEAMLNRVASEIVLKNEGGSRETYGRMVNLYEKQPNLSIRTSTSIDNQAYSTPLPLAFIADRFAGMGKGVSVYEPTAGNGALLIASDQGVTYANEMNPARAATLKSEGFKITMQDATTFTPPFRTDAVVANPPFGKLDAPIQYDGYSIVKLDHLIAVKALSVMKDEGRGAIIIGAGSRERAGDVTNAARPFFNYLYSHYNVVADFELEGDLYARQGASFPVRVIAVDGRTRTAKVSPVETDIQRLKTWEEVYAKASEHLGPNLEGRPRTDDELSSASQLRADTESVPGAVDRPAEQGNSVRPGEGQGADAGDREHVGAAKPGIISHSGRVPAPPVGSPDITARSDGDVALSDRLPENQPAPRVVRREPAESDGRPANDAVATEAASALTDESNQFQVTYRPRSEKKDVSVMAPKALIGPMHSAMDAISKDAGDLDEFVANELGYPSIDELHAAFMGIQTDAIAAAIHQLKQGKALIVADQTGVGKGRVAAAMIRWAELHGHLPIFVTEKPTLFSDMYGDLTDIGSANTISPLLLNSDASITNRVTGEKIFRNNGSMKPVMDRIRETGTLPPGRNALFLSYSQVNTDNRQQLVLHRLSPNAVFVLDESHNAGGASATGDFISEVIGKSKGVVFLSATWAKRPDNLPVYAGKTDISIAIPDKERVADAIAAGGAPLQAVVTSQLAQAGQFVRRERSFDGIDIKNVVDTDNKAKHEKISDKVTEVLRAITKADSLYHNLDFDRILAKAKKAGKSAQSKGVVVSHMEFSSIVHNMVKQLLLALKADSSADLVIQSIERGERPVYALENTMGSFLGNYVDGHNLSVGDSLAGLTYSKICDRALMRTRYYNETDEMGNKTRIEVPLEDLSEATRKAYDEAQELIDNLNVDLPVSPLDHIRARIEKAGYKVAEITGRDLRIDYSGDRPVLSTVPDIERKDRVNTATQFNNGSIDALIINKAAAAGISLHASEKFLDKRPRHMIVGQPAGDVNVVMQMLGRINRTGQVELPSYTMFAAALPAEMRPAIVLAKKMKSLNANVSSNTRSATSVKAVDMFNKYGDKIVAQYLLDNPEASKLLGLDAESDNKGEAAANEGLAMKATGHSALLSVKDQQIFMDAITEAYTNYIDFLDETGQNDLEPVTYDYQAREMHIERMYQGTDPSSPFGQDAHYGEYSIKRQGKPFTPEEVQAKLAEAYGPELMTKPPHERDTLFARSLAAYFEENYEAYRKTLTTPAAMDKAADMRHRGRQLLNEYRVGAAFGLDINGDLMHGVVTNIEGSKKLSGNPYAPSSLQFTLAVNTPLRSIRVPGSQIHKIAISNLGRNADIPHLFRDNVGDSRQKTKIITGNLLGAYGELKAGVKGRIISFTMQDGTTQLGIQMPTKFDINTDVSENYAMRSPEAAFEYLKAADNVVLQSSGQEIGVMGKRDGTLSIRTKVSKSVAGKFFLDPRLRELVIGGDFVSSGGMMKATVKDGMGLDALDVIMGKTALYAPASGVKQARRFDEEAAKGTLSGPSKAKKMLGGEEGFANVDLLVPSFVRNKVIPYFQKAVPATWGELSKAVGTVKKTPKAIGYEIASVLYPAVLADADARDIMGRALGEPALELFKASLFLNGIDKMFQGMPEKDWIEFVDRIQNGVEQPTPDLQHAQEMLQSVLEGQRLAEQAAINLGRTAKNKTALSDRENYFPNRYAKPPGDTTLLNDNEQIARMMPKKPFQGSKAFMKQQKYTLKDAVKDGAVPLGNPVKMVLRRLQEGAKFVAAQQALWDGRQTGLIVYKSARGKMPPNFVKMQDNIAKVFRPVETSEGGTVFVEGGEWVIDKDFGRLFNNYLSQDHIRSSTIGSGFVQLKTSSTAFKMGMSAFHYGTMTFWSIASQLHAGLDEFYNQGARGLDPAKMVSGAKKLATSIAAPLTTVRGGAKIVNYLKDPESFLGTKEGEKLARDYPDLPELLRLVYAGGFRAGMNEDFPQNSPMTLGKDFAAGRLVSGTMKVLPFAAHALAYPLFNYIIPRIKLMANVQMLSQKLEQYSQAIANGDITPETVARSVVATNENSFGEFNYENNYWNNTVKTAVQLLFLAPGWKEGTWRGAAQAAKEVFTEGYADKFYEKVEQEGKAEDWAHKYASKLPQLGLNSGRLLSGIIVATAIATVLEKTLTGKWIWESIHEDMQKNGLNILQAADLEALHPRTGKTDKYGKPVRFNLPTDLRDYEHATVSLGSYVYGSFAPWLTGIVNTLRNRDWKGDYVYNPAEPDGKGFEAFKQGIYYNLQQSFEPITASNYLDKNAPKDTQIKVAKTAGLIGGAPKGYDVTRATARAQELREAHDPHRPLTPEQQSEKDMLKEAPPTRAQAKYALRTRNLTELDNIVMNSRFSYTDAKDVFEHATPEEKKSLLPIMRKKQAEAVRNARKR